MTLSNYTPDFYHVNFTSGVGPYICWYSLPMVVIITVNCTPFGTLVEMIY